MGWLILSIIILIVCIVFNTLNEINCWQFDFIEFVGVVIGSASFAASFILIACMIDSKNSAKVTIDMYDNIVELNQELGVSSDAIMEKTLELNEEILEHRVRVNKFMTKGLYSEDVANLPLLELPEIMKDIPIDYD